MIKGIEERALKPIKTKEVKEVAWIPLADYIQETMHQNCLEAILSPPRSKYCTYFVKCFAYFASEWQQLVRAGKPEASNYCRVSMHDQMLESCPESVKCITTLCLEVKEFAIVYKELPFFMHAFYYHFMLGDLDKAERLYRDALRRSEYTMGCYNMLIAIYLSQTEFGQQFDLLCQKMQALEQEFGHFFAYDPEVFSQSVRVSDALQFQFTQVNMLKAAKDLMVLDISKIFRFSSTAKMNDQAEQYRAKFVTMRQFRFDPFVYAATIVAAPQHRQDLFSFHSKTKFSGFAQEIALVEIGSEREAFGLKSLFRRHSQIRVVAILPKNDIKVDGSTLEKAKEAQIAKFRKEKGLKHAESMYIPKHTADYGLDYFAQQSQQMQRPQAT